MSGKKKLRIVSDGTAVGTHIYAGEEELCGVVRIDFEPLEAGGFLMVRLTAIGEYDLIAEDACEELSHRTDNEAANLVAL